MELGYMALTVLFGIIVVSLFAHWKFVFCFRCGKPIRKSSSYNIVKNNKWLCKTCYKIASLEIPGLMVKRKGALKYWKNNDGYYNPKIMFLLMIVLLILTVCIMCHHYFNVILP